MVYRCNLFSCSAFSTASSTGGGRVVTVPVCDPDPTSRTLPREHCHVEHCTGMAVTHWARGETMAYLKRADIANLGSIRRSLISGHGTAASLLLPHGRIRHTADRRQGTPVQVQCYCEDKETTTCSVTVSESGTKADKAAVNTECWD